MSTIEQATTAPSFFEAIADTKRGLEAMAQVVLLQNLPDPYGQVMVNGGVWVYAIQCVTAEEMATVTRKLTAGAALGEIRKVNDDGYARVFRRFGSHVELEVWAPRSAVCERVVVGTETVEIPDPDAPKVTVEREVVEWRCSPLLAAGETAA